MTKKRLRYSELATPQLPPAEPAAPAPTPEPASSAADEAAVLPAPAPVDASSPEPDDAPLEIISTANDDLLATPSEDVFAVERYDEMLLLEPVLKSSLVEPVVPILSALDERAQDSEAERAEAQAPTESAAPARPRRNSTPVELARTLTAERAAARAREGLPPEVDPASELPAEETLEPKRSLRERARTKSGSAELLMFFVGAERFAVELILVDEVIDLPIIHHVPEMPPAMLGVVTVRGALTPVYSPQHALGRTLAVRDALLIFRRGSHRVGILIDDVDDALTVDMAELREKPAGEEGDNVLLGVIRLANTLVGVIDADALITACQSANILEPA